MGNISTILAALFCATAPLSSISIEARQIEQSISNFKLGKDRVSFIRKNYTEGQYKEILERIDEDYKQASLSSLIQMRQKQVPLNLQGQIESRFIALQNEKNQAVLDALTEEDTEFAALAKSASSNVTTGSQRDALSKINSFITMAPGTGANEDENALIDLDLEYEYKILHADIPKSSLTAAEKEEISIALRMEKLEKMQKIAKQFKDLSLKNAVGIVAAGFDERLAHTMDGIELNRRFKSEKAKNKEEEEVYKVISSYQSKFQELLKQSASDS